MYKPLQTFSLQKNNLPSGLTYQEYQPRPELREYVACYWILNSGKDFAGTLPYRVLPDGCVDILFNLKESTVQKARLVGTMENPALVTLSANTQLLGIRFLPGSAFILTKHPVNLFTDRAELLTDLWGDKGRSLTESLMMENSLSDRIKLIDNKLKEIFFTGQEINPLLRCVLHIIYTHRGQLPIEKLSQLSGTGTRRLGRIFEKWIGVSPKSFCRIVRFQSALNSLLTCPQTPWIDVALSNGYYDQAHFINEFKAFYGVAPSQVLQPPQVVRFLQD